MTEHRPDCPKHHCHAAACGRHVKPEKLMCAKHWKMVPSEIQRAVTEPYRVISDLSATWYAAADAAICVVAHQEWPTLAPPHRNCQLKDLYRSVGDEHA